MLSKVILAQSRPKPLSSVMPTPPLLITLAATPAMGVFTELPVEVLHLIALHCDQHSRCTLSATTRQLHSVCVSLLIFPAHHSVLTVAD